MNISRKYKFELQLPLLKDRLTVRIINDDEDSIIHSFFEILHQFYEYCGVEDTKNQKRKLKELCHFADGKSIPFDESIVQSEIIDYCLDKYNRSQQNTDFGYLGLFILKCFAHSDSRYLDILIEKNFIEVCQRFIFTAYPTYYPIEIDILNCLISHSTTYNYLEGFDIVQLIRSSKSAYVHGCVREFYMFLAKFFSLYKVSEDAVFECFEHFKKIKEKVDPGYNYYIYDTEYWPEILFHLIRSDYFNIESFFDSALYDFYEQNYNNHDQIFLIGQFYSSFIVKYPKLRTALSFDYFYYIQLIQNDENYSDDICENSARNEKVILFEEGIRSVAYNTLAIFMQVFLDQQQKEIKEGIPSEIDFINFILQIPDDFVESQIIEQVFFDYYNSSWNVKLNSLFFLSTFTIIRPIYILKYKDPAEYIDLFSNFIHSGFLDSILLSFESIYGVISKFSDFKEICQEVADTEMYQNLSQLVGDDDNDDEFDQDTLDRIQNFLREFSNF